MAVLAGSFEWYFSAIHYLWTGRIDTDTDTFKMGLSSVSYVPSKTTHSLLSHITGELSGNGYARQTLTGAAVTPNASPFAALQKLDFNNPVFSAVGGSLVARWWWIYDDTPSSPLDPLFCYGLLDATPADVTTLDGNVLTFDINALGLATLEEPA